MVFLPDLDLVGGNVMIRNARRATFIGFTVLVAVVGQPAAVLAQDAQGDQKFRSDMADAELARMKTMQDMIVASKGTATGTATLTDIDAGAEVLLLRNRVETNLGRQLAERVGPGGDRPILLIFGDRPPTTAHYLSLRRGEHEFRLNAETANKMARSVFAPKAGKPKAKKPKPGYLAYVESDFIGAAAGPVGVGLSAISTVISLLRVDTDLKGKALASTAESLGPIVANELTLKGWKVQAPEGIATQTLYADEIVEGLRPQRDEAATYYAIYLSRLQAKEGKVENLTEPERIAGQAVATVVGDYSSLVSGLFVPVNGVLPATVIQEEKALADKAPDQSLLFVTAHEAAMTSITKKGFLTGIIGIPAYVSASSIASYTLLDRGGAQFGSISYQTPVMRVTDVAKWARKDNR